MFECYNSLTMQMIVSHGRRQRTPKPNKRAHTLPVSVGISIGQFQKAGNEGVAAISPAAQLPKALFVISQPLTNTKEPQAHSVTLSWTRFTQKPATIQKSQVQLPQDHIPSSLAKPPELQQNLSSYPTECEAYPKRSNLNLYEFLGHHHSHQIETSTHSRAFVARMHWLNR